MFRFILLFTLIPITIFSQVNYYKNCNNLNDTNNFLFPNEFLLDTINLFGQEKNQEFFNRRFCSAIYKNIYYSEILRKLQEPKLYRNYPNEVYRFTWQGYLATLHNPLSIRIENNNGNIIMYIKYNKKNIMVSDTLLLDKQVWTELKNKIDSLNFWEISPVEKTEIVVMDGSVWILEGKKGNLYHMVHRKSGKNKEIGEICMYLIKKSKLKIRKKELY